MAADAPTNNCIVADITSNITVSNILSHSLFGAGPGGEELCASLPTTSAVNMVIDRIQSDISSIDLSFYIPQDHPKIPSYIASAVGGRYAIDLPQLRTLVGIQLGFTAAILSGVAFAFIIYYALLNGGQKREEKTKSTANSPLVRGIIGLTLMVAAVLAPYAIIGVTNEQNTAVRATILVFFVVYLFRISEAAFDFVHPGAKASFGLYCAYFAIPFNMSFDENNKPVMATKSDVWDGILAAGMSFARGVILFSIISACNYIPFGETNEGEFVMNDIFNIRNIGNNLAILATFQQYLSFADVSVASAIQIFLGYKTKPAFPSLLEAKSPSDGWGRKWNVSLSLISKV